LLKFAGNVAYSADVRLSSVLEVVLLLEEEEEVGEGKAGGIGEGKGGSGKVGRGGRDKRTGMCSSQMLSPGSAKAPSRLVI